MWYGEGSDEALKDVNTSNSGRRRLRAAASFAPPSSLNGSHTPSCMAVRRITALDKTCISGPSLVAIAGPMGITISELNSSSSAASSSYGGLRTWMVLDYCSGYSSRCRSTRQFSAASGGISCMSFQPSSISNDDGGSILLAVARGSGILLYDCSGRALNPLLGRLDAQVWDSRKRVIVSGNSGSVGSRVGSESIKFNNSVRDGAGMGHHRAPSSSTTIATNGNANDDSLLPSGINMNAMNNNNDAVIIPSTNLIAEKNQTGWRGENDDAVTSMDWKPSASVLLATCGVAACVWDLRTSSLGGGGVRPNSRFVVRSEDDEYGNYVGSSRCSRSLVHCAYCRNESDHTFGTLDYGGVVRVWDDRYPTHLYRSFLACPGGGVGIASFLCQSTGSASGGSWVTWGMDEKGEDGDDLIIAKVWTESSLPRLSLSRSMTEGVAVRPRSPPSPSYRAIARISMPGGVAARVHPSFHDTIMLFGKERLIDNTEEELGHNENIFISGKPEPPLPSHAIGGKWKAELWSIDAGSGNSSSAVDKHRCVGARMITSFCVNGVEEDALSFSRIGGDFSVMAVDLANGVNSSEDELTVCVLTEAGRLTIYGVPEISRPKPSPACVENENSSHPALSCVFRQSTDHRGNEWWDKNEEEVLFGEEPNTANISPNKSLAPKSTLEQAFVSSIISDADEDSIVEPIRDVVIHPDVASRVPCPPMCGIAFSGVGTVATFNNGPVKRMWSLYQSSRRKSTPTSHNMSQIVFLPQLMTKEVDIDVDDDENDALIYNKRAGQKQTYEKEKLLPKTLLDLMEMNRQHQSLQWGDGENDHTDIHLLHDSSGDNSNNSSSKIISGVNNSDENGDYSASMSDAFSQSSASDDDKDCDCLYQSASNGTPTEVNASMFDAYFSSSRTPLLGGEVEEHHNKNGAFTGFPSLSPSVMISQKHKDILLNGQSPLLAKLLKLGDQWWLTEDFTIPYSIWQTDKRNATVDEQPLRKTASAMRSLSDPPLLKSSKHVSMMGNLKKLFVNQLPTAMTPPDQRLLNRRSKQKENLGNDGVNKLYPGVYMVNNSPTPEAASQQLAISQKLCFHNAQVCSDCGQKGKADTWRLLAQTIESIFTFQMDETSGWGGNDEALTTGLVKQILLYYEGESDFQMLSTIVSVLTLGRDRRCLSSGGGGKYRILPNFDERQYDNYLHQYAALLYSWDLLTVRTEIEKRIAYPMHGTGTETLTWLETGQSRPWLARGIGCEPVVADNKTSHGVEDSSLECAICCSSVRGACTWCPKCGHGGHVNHVMQWFQQHSVCPTGCGCVCLKTAERAQ